MQQLSALIVPQEPIAAMNPETSPVMSTADSVALRAELTAARAATAAAEVEVELCRC